jgi:hypothetical protein
MFGKMFKQNLALGLVAAAVVAGVAATPAHAGNSAYCSGTWVCVYKNSFFDTPLGYRTAGFTLQNISSANQNQVSSWENRTTSNARWYTNTNGAGTCNNMAKNSELGFMDPFTQNDRMISWAGNGSC